MKYFKLTLPAALFALVSCGPVVPIVSDYNGDSVKIQVSSMTNDPEGRAKIDAEAQRICRTGSKKRAEFASVRQLPDYNVEYLYLCLN